MLTKPQYIYIYINSGGGDGDLFGGDEGDLFADLGDTTPAPGARKRAKM